MPPAIGVGYCLSYMCITRKCSFTAKTLCKLREACTVVFRKGRARDRLADTPRMVSCEPQIVPRAPTHKILMVHRIRAHILFGIVKSETFDLFG